MEVIVACFKLPSQNLLVATEESDEEVRMVAPRSAESQRGVIVETEGIGANKLWFIIDSVTLSRT
jgi:hypothetical protein